MDPKTYLKDLLDRTLASCSPGQAVSRTVSITDGLLTVNEAAYSVEDRPVYLIAAGKAAVPMTRSIEQILGDQLTAGLAIAPATPDAHGEPASELIFGSHPLPDSKSVTAGRQLVDFVQTIPPGALVLSLISGGTSSLVCLPAGDISTGDLRTVYKLLNRSGATIREINAVRKHCSLIKGGRLLHFFPADISLVDLIVSDVPGNDPAIIGSGLTTPDASTFQDAYDILEAYHIWDELPRSVQGHMQKGVNGNTAGTPGPGEDPVNDHNTFIISSAEQFAQKAAEFARQDGYSCTVAGEPFNDDVGIVAEDILKKVRTGAEEKSGPQLYLFYGESTVQVRGEGKGGRNQELALNAGLKIAGEDDISWLSAGTDGIDGPTDAAGAIVDGHTIPRARQKGLSPQEYLEKNDSYHFHRRAGTLLKTGATGNNLMDAAWVLVNAE